MAELKDKPELTEEDLEDGEIDDSDEEASAEKAEPSTRVDKKDDVIIVDKNSEMPKPKHNPFAQKQPPKSTNKLLDSMVTIDLSSDKTPPRSLHNLMPMPLKTKSAPVIDDFAGNIENAIAQILKKKGIEPTLPKMLESKIQQQNKDSQDESSSQHISSSGQGQSKSSRRRKRKKQKEEKKREEEEKERSEKKKRYESPDPTAPPPLGDEDDLDDYEMLNVRGGSPPPVSNAPPTAQPPQFNAFKERYQSDSYDDTDDSESYDSDESERRRRRRKNDRRKDKRRDDDGKRSSDKRSRRDSMDEKHRNDPKKLELCKFYLMECCAKRDKCSYMHSDFPCKYYYLGMDCPAKEDCKFAHTEPLSEELRNILLKHLEMAPKEILGNFKRISRENALTAIVKRHEELCRKYNVQNVWAPVTAASLPIHNNRRNNNSGSSNNASNSGSSNNSGIPSLLDMVVEPPAELKLLTSCDNSGSKQRKSRWSDNNSSSSKAGNSSSSSSATSNNNNSKNSSKSDIAPPSKKAPSYLDLKNLVGVLSKEHIEKLSEMGIVNLEQVNQLTFGQLNLIGLTIAEITQIQLNAMSMAKLGVLNNNNSSNTVSVAKNSPKAMENSQTSSLADLTSFNGDVDMRFLPNVPATASTTENSAELVKPKSPEKDNTNSNSNSNGSGIVMVDYSQYLKDSNLAFDKSDIYDDEKDDEQLVIDDGNMESDDQQQSSKRNSQESIEEKPDGALNNSNTFGSDFTTKLNQLTDIAQALRNPFKNADFYTRADENFSPKDEKDQHKNKAKAQNPFAFSAAAAAAANNDDDNRFYGSNRKRRDRSRSRSRTPTRSQSNTPEASLSPTAPLGAQLEVEDILTKTQHQFKDIEYERKTIYDYRSKFAEEDEQKLTRQKADKDMRFLPSATSSSGLSDIDLRLPFQPMTNYTPACEIDGSITSHLPITYKVNEVDVPRASYAELRQHFKSDAKDIKDPRLRRIFGLTELSQTKTSAALSRKVRKSSNTSSIASPSDTEGSSPKYYTPPSATSITASALALEERMKASSSSAASASQSSSRGDPRGDPRRQDPRSQARNDNAPAQSNSPTSIATTTTATTTVSTTANATNSVVAQKQNIEIRNLLQKSEWYKNLNSKFKIMVNQQLALVSTELKKFHQDTSPNKIFDISFIVNNQTLQQILTNLGIFIDDNGEVAHVDADEGDDRMDAMQQQPNQNNNNNVPLPNLSQPPPNAAVAAVVAALNAQTPGMDFLHRGPPPMMQQQGGGVLGPMFQRPPMPMFNARPSLLGLPPGAQGNPLNPFAGPMPPNLGINPNLLAGGPGAAAALLSQFGPNFMPPQRNFNNQRNNQQRNQNRRI